jgi:mono/diheme cytochrome c family protein
MAMTTPNGKQKIKTGFALNKKGEVLFFEKVECLGVQRILRAKWNLLERVILLEVIIASGLFLGWTPPLLAQDVPAATEAKSQSQPERKFLTSCAGCHTVGKGKLTGPDLISSAKWPKPDLKAAIKRMEPKAGPLTEEEIEGLALLISDPQVLPKLEAEEAKMAQMFAAKMDPASAEVGQALYEGRLPLKNGGLACAACHTMGAEGNILGPDLSRVSSKMSEIALSSAIEKSSFKIMDAAYREHPVTKQEAMHVAKYLSQKNPEHRPMAVSIPLKAGMISAALLLGGLVFVYRSSRRITHPELQRRRK